MLLHCLLWTFFIAFLFILLSSSLFHLLQARIGIYWHEFGEGENDKWSGLLFADGCRDGRRLVAVLWGISFLCALWGISFLRALWGISFLCALWGITLWEAVCVLLQNYSQWKYYFDECHHWRFHFCYCSFWDFSYDAFLFLSLFLWKSVYSPPPVLQPCPVIFPSFLLYIIELASPPLIFPLMADGWCPYFDCVNLNC